MTNRPRIIEVVGLAATGKSTLVRSMQQRNEEIQIFPLPKINFFGSLIKRSFLWLPLLFQNHQRTKHFTREELISIGCLDAWLPYLQSKTLSGTDIALLDSGSIYWLTRLQGFGTERSSYQRWCEDKFEEWSSALDLIIWLDAPEELCLQRALARDEWHAVKDMTAQKVLERFRGFRNSYEQIISRMASDHSKKVFRFRTDQISTEQMVDQIFSEVDLAPLCEAQLRKTNPSAQSLVSRPSSR